MNNIYVMSDIHGHYDAFIEMLNKINLNINDKLYILGDVIDHNPGGIKILKHIMDKQNIELIIGNHEELMIKNILLNELNINDNFITLDGNIRMSLDWMGKGGLITLKTFMKEAIEIQKKITDFLLKSIDHKLINVNNQNYFLIHDGLLIPENKDLKEYITGNIVVFGHTPTIYIPQYIDSITEKITHKNINKCKAFEIYISKYRIGIDCGCASKKGKLGCLRLNDMKEFYVKL